MSEIWSLPDKVPPGTKSSGPVNSIILSDGFFPKVFPIPLLREETDLSTKPSSGVCFPLHPLGIVRLFDTARELVEGYKSLPLDDVEKVRLPGHIWQAVLRAYQPGEPIRAGLERLVDGIPLGTKVTETKVTDEEISNDRLRLLSLHIVSLAIYEWAAGVE